jgi:hypothetical protein
MNHKRLPFGTWLFTLVFTLWLSVAVPILLYSLLTLQVPLWPNFGPESTWEGIFIWAVLAAWFYLIPVILIAVNRRGRSSHAA